MWRPLRGRRLGRPKSEPGRAQAAPPVGAAGAESAWRQVNGPATGLIITAILNWVAIPLTFLVTAFVFVRTSGAGSPARWVLLVPLLALVLSSVMLWQG